MEIRVDSLDFSQSLSGSGPRPASRTFVFPRAVKTAVAGLSGYVAEFSNGDDHHLGRVEIRLETTILDNTVTVDGTFGLRDWSGDWDDEYAGSIDVTVVAELESATQLPPRGDLIITGVEFNQAVQYFRSHRYLDPANARPDNSVFMIAGKNTGVRVYVDWDSTAGLAPINKLSGELVVDTGATTMTLSPINPGAAIVPKRDSNIHQARSGDTLNFMIPASVSAGTLTVTCAVFDQADPTQRSSAFSRTLVFTPVEPLNIFLVGVETENPALPAPTQAEITAGMSMVFSCYPRGDIVLTGYTTISDAGTFTDPAPNDGCGSGWDNVLDSLSDLRGGSDDVYFGGLPATLVCSASVGGCSPIGNRHAAAFVDVPPAVAHELGHSLGRLHARCAGCSPAPQFVDPNYPLYNGFIADSIGVFGFDPTTNQVFEPGFTTDFMHFAVTIACFGGMVAVLAEWISPYTYQGLLGGSGGGPGNALTLLSGRQRMTLFLGLTIARDRSVHRRCSFHHDAKVQGRSSCDSEFSYEFLDAKGKVLDCGALHCRCTGDCRCWPKVFREPLPMPKGSRVLVIWEGDKKIYEEKIPDPPEVRIVSQKKQKDGILLKWDSKPEKGLWYLVHWEDAKHGTFRGVAPRLQEKSLLIPDRLLKGGDLRVRVYASSGIATGYAETQLKGEHVGLDRPRLTLLATSNAAGGRQSSFVATVLALDSTGGRIPQDRITWYGKGGNELARGRDLDLRMLPVGSQVIRAVVKRHGDGVVGKSWLVERDVGGWRLLHPIPDPPPRRTHEEHEHPHPAPPPRTD